MRDNGTDGSPTHVRLPGTTWSIWRQALLRSAGFPADGIELLASPGLAALADRLPGPTGSEDAEWRGYRESFGAEMARLSDRVLRIAGDERARLALAWQNYRVLDTAVAPLQRHQAADRTRRNRRDRAHQELIAGYWQRYCVKNDTIGFFGPMAWAAIDPDAVRTRVRPGRSLLAAAGVFFETWPVDRLAAVIAALPGMAPWIPPSRLPFVRLDGNRAVRPGRAPVELTPVEAAVLRLSVGDVPARDIAAVLAARRPDRVDPADSYAAIRRLASLHLLTWKIPVPLAPHPEQALRRFLSQVGDPLLAGAGLELLDDLEKARDDAWAAAQGDSGGFVAALRDLDRTFEKISGTPPYRHGGKAYGARSLIYHDARRDVQVVLGSDFLTALAPLDLVLASARWVTRYFSTRVNDLLAAVAQRMSAERTATDIASFWYACMPRLYQAGPAIADEARRACQRGWADILRPAIGASRLQVSADEIRGRVLSVFASPPPDWAGGRYCSVDVLLATRDAGRPDEADGFDVVLGEVHLAIAASRNSACVSQHPSPDRLFSCLASDFPGPRLLPVLPKEDHQRLTVRTHPALIRDIDYLVALSDQTADPRRGRLLRAADLTVRPAPAGPVVDIPGGPRFPVVDVFSELLTHLVIDSFAVLPPAEHQPRVTIDQFVLCRETWRFTSAALGFAREADEAARFAAARRWRLEHRLPEQVFVKVPGEVKPFLTDFRSVLSVNLLAKSVRQLQARDAAEQLFVEVSEMLPSIPELWLTDAAGSRYTSEIRIVAADPGVNGPPRQRPAAGGVSGH